MRGLGIAEDGDDECWESLAFHYYAQATVILCAVQVECWCGL